MSNTDDIHGTARGYFLAKMVNGAVPTAVVGGEHDGLRYFPVTVGESEYWLTENGLFTPPESPSSPSERSPNPEEEAMDAQALNALRTLLDPEAVAAWLDEVDAHRRRRSQEPAAIPTVVGPRPVTAEPLLTVRQLSERLGVGRHTVYELVKQNAIPHVRLGQHIRFVWSRVQDWMDDPSTL
jgi:excisionase family DNA binding protein